MITFLRSFLKKTYNAITRFVLQALKIQLLLSLFSLPILVTWGFSLSYLAIAGNLFFGPFITAYLLCALIWFLATLCSLPSVFPAFLLEQITQWWLWFLSFASQEWLFALPCPSFYLVGFIPVSTLITLIGCSHLPIRRQICIYALLLSGWYALLLCSAQKTMSSIQQHKNGTLYIVPCANGVVLVDYEGVVRSSSFQNSWVTFSLKPTLAQRYGLRACTAIILAKPSPRRLEAARQLLELGVAPLIQVPSWAYQQAWFTAWQAAHPHVQLEPFNSEYLLLHPSFDKHHKTWNT